MRASVRYLLIVLTMVDRFNSFVGHHSSHVLGQIDVAGIRDIFDAGKFPPTPGGPPLYLASSLLLISPSVTAKLTLVVGALGPPTDMAGPEFPELSTFRLKSHPPWL